MIACKVNILAASQGNSVYFLRNLWYRIKYFQINDFVLTFQSSFKSNGISFFSQKIYKSNNENFKYKYLPHILLLYKPILLHIFQGKKSQQKLRPRVQSTTKFNVELLSTKFKSYVFKIYILLFQNHVFQNGHAVKISFI